MSPPDLVAIVHDPAHASFRELDERLGRPKGSAFRAFKALGAALVEGRDFHCCDSRVDELLFQVLYDSGRLYPGTVNGVLLGADAQAAIAARLASPEA
ncbi:MAG: hypothetical protein AB7I01_07785 [Gammaproteobacteria bacterium]